MKINLKIQKLIYKKDYVLEIYFSDNSKQIIDFYPFISQARHPEITKYLDKRKFKKYKLVDGELMWGDFDLLFPISDLYNNQIIKKISQAG